MANDKIKKEGELDGLDGYYHTGTQDKQSMKDNRNLQGEVDQFSFRLEHSVAENYHGPPEYALEESWRDWDKFTNDDFSKEAGQSYHDQALEKSKKDELYKLLNDTLEIDNLSITLIGRNVFVSGQTVSQIDRESINELIKSVGDLDNVVNHIQLDNEFNSGPEMIMRKDLGLDRGMYESR